MAEKFSEMMKRLRAQEAAAGRPQYSTPTDTAALDPNAPAADPVAGNEADTVDSPAPVPTPAPAPKAGAPEYKGGDLDEAKINHIANGIRAKFEGDFDMSGMSDREILQRHRARFASEMTPEAYDKKLKDTYLADFKPTLMQSTTPLRHAVGEAAVGLAPYAAAEVPGMLAGVGTAAFKAGAGQVAKALGGAPTQLAFAAGHAGNMAVDEAFILDQQRKMAQVAAGPNVEGRTQEYFGKLAPGLRAQGFTDDEIMGEASRRARNAELGKQQTIDSMDQDLDAMQRTQITEPARAAADALFLGAGAGPLNKALQAMGLVAKEGAVAAKAVNPILQAAKHAATGAIVGGLGLGVQGATRAALEAGAANLSPADIAHEMVRGGIEEGSKGAEGGFALGGGLGLLGESVGALARLPGERAAKAAAKADAVAEEVSGANAAALRKNQAEYADKARLSKLSDESAAAYQKRVQADKITNTAVTFRADRTQYPLQGDPYVVAQGIVASEHGSDALQTPAGLKAIDVIGNKIKLAQAAENETANFKNVALPPTEPTGGPPSLTSPGALAGPGQAAESAPTMETRPLEPRPVMQGEAQLPPTGLRTQMNELQAPPASGIAPNTEPAIEPRERLAVPPQPEVTPAMRDARVREVLGVPETPLKKPRAKAVEAAPAAVPAPVVTPREEALAPAAPSASSSTVEPRALNAEVAGATPASPATPEAPANRAAEALGKLSVGEHAVVKEQNGALHIERLGLPGGVQAERGALGKVLDHITTTADEHGVPVTMRLTKIDSNGGKIPIEKQMKNYLAPRGFEITASTKLPEGQMATADVIRQPIGQHQAQVAASLDKVAEAARARLNSKLGRANAGFDPTMIGDAALDLAASMFAKKLRDPESLASYLVGKYGEVVKPFIEKISAMAQKSFTRMFKDTGTAEKNLDDLLALKESGKYGMGWYDKTAKWVKQQFGEDSDMFLRFLAVTSANGQTESGAAMALKAYSQWKGGMPFEGFRGDSMRGQLESAAKGEPLPPNTKIKNFLDALRGDPNAVVLDRWMLRALKMNDVTALKPNNYKMYESAVRQLAADNSMSPAEFQAAVWEGARVGSIQEKEAIGGRAASTKTGSARPLEDLVDRKLGGLTPEEYAHEATDHLKMMQNLYQGLAPVRKAIEKADEGHWVKTEGATADQSGHTFDPNTFEPAKHEGNVVSLISHNAKRNVLYPGRILKFKQQVQPLIDEMEKKGLKPTIGVWQLTDPKTKMPTGEFSLDLNIMVDDKDKAMEIARDNKQLAVAHLGPGGEFQGVTETGHKGKQNLPPKDYKEQPAWYKQQINRVRSFVKKAGL